MKTKFFSLLLLIIGLTSSTHGQEYYRTFSGDIVISLTNHDSIVLLVSHKLLVSLDYETSKISLKVPIETFRTGIDSFDERLKAVRNSDFEFTGKLGITINSRRFDPQRYNMEGLITSATVPAAVRGNGSMTCIPAGDKLTPACTLLLSMETTLSALHLRDAFPTANEQVRIDLRQSILERQTN